MTLDTRPTLLRYLQQIGSGYRRRVGRAAERVGHATRTPAHLYRTHALRHPTKRRRGKLHFFNLDLHAAVIADITDLLADFDAVVTDWSLSSHAPHFGKSITPAQVVNRFTWRDLNAMMAERFRHKYDRYLRKFDGFICTYPPAFLSLFLPYGKPIICVAATRYEHPFTLDKGRWAGLDEQLRRGVETGQVTLIANNRADADYLQHYIKIAPRYIPSICRYTHARYSGARDQFAIGSRSVEIADALQKGTGSLAYAQSRLFSSSASWNELYSVQGWVHVPYNISQMSFFEQYFAGCPLFMPSDSLLQTWRIQWPGSVLSELSFFDILGESKRHLPTTDPNRCETESELQWWLDRADFAEHGELRFVQRFSSIDHLKELLETTDLCELSASMEQHNQVRVRHASDAWQSVVAEIERSVDG